MIEKEYEDTTVEEDLDALEADVEASIEAVNTAPSS